MVPVGPIGRVRYPHQGASVSQRCNTTVPTVSESTSVVAPTVAGNSCVDPGGPTGACAGTGPTARATGLCADSRWVCSAKASLEATNTPRLNQLHSLTLVEAVRNVDTSRTRPGDVFRGLLRLTCHRPGCDAVLIGQVVAIDPELQILARLETHTGIQGGKPTQVPEIRRVCVLGNYGLARIGVGGGLQVVDRGIDVTSVSRIHMERDFSLLQQWDDIVERSSELRLGTPRQALTLVPTKVGADKLICQHGIRVTATDRR